MNKKVIAFLSVFILFLSTPLISANAVAKAGAKCAKAGNTEVVKGKSYTCIKTGKKLVWDKGVSTSTSKSGSPSKAEVVIDFYKTYSTDNGYYDNFVGPQARDPKLTSEWLEVQKSFEQIRPALGPVRIAKYNLGNARPVTSFQPSKEFTQIDLCKISIANDRNRLSHYPDSYRSQRKHPGPNSIIQLIPIYAEDTAKPINSPSQDYLKYLNLIKEWIDYSSDFGSNAQIRIPTEYIKFPNKVEPYKLIHPVNWDTPGHVRFNQDVISTVDPVIDFSGAHIGIVVAPPGTEASIMQQAALGSFKTSEGLVVSASSQFATLAANMKQASYAGLGEPFWWIHELYHVGYGFDDRYGDSKNNISGEYGMGWWTLMTPFGGDLSVWEKWLIGFVQDSQIQCVSNPISSTHWIAPASVKTQESKAVVVPISATKVVVAESIRPAGLHYKVAQQYQGVLVYEVDLTKTEHGMGMKLSLPTNRNVNNRSAFFLADASLRKGDSTTSNGITFTILESGSFGDVIKISKN